MAAPYAQHTPANDSSAPVRGQSQPYAQHATEEHSWFGNAAVGVEHLFQAAYDKAKIVVHDIEDTAVRLAYVAVALELAQVYAPVAIAKKIGMDVVELAKAFIPGLLLSLAIVALTTFVGGGIGALLAGLVSGGAAAVPGAIVGGELGFDAGVLILDALGIYFLLEQIFHRIPVVFDMVRQGIETAWNVNSNPKRPLSQKSKKPRIN
jgi:hypothetical protein